MVRLARHACVCDQTTISVADGPDRVNSPFAGEGVVSGRLRRGHSQIVQTRRATGGEPGARIVYLSGSGDRCPRLGLRKRARQARRGWSAQRTSGPGEALMTRTAVSVRLIAGAPVALVDHARAEGPGLDQVQR